MTTEPATWPDRPQPRASAERIQSFLDAFGTRRFRHADELVAIMRRDDRNESYIVCYDMRLDDRLRRIYRGRARRLASAPPSPYHPSGLAEDVFALASQLEEASDQKIQLWIADLRSGTTYLVFELMDDVSIAGCVKSADQRVVNPSDE